MIRMHFTFEDHTIIAERNSVDWNVIICDHTDGAEKHYKWDDGEFAAVMALAINEESGLLMLPGSLDTEATSLYDEVSHIVWGPLDNPNKFRIIP